MCDCVWGGCWGVQTFRRKDFAGLEEAKGRPSANHQSGPRIPSQMNRASRQAGGQALLEQDMKVARTRGTDASLAQSLAVTQGLRGCIVCIINQQMLFHECK